MAITVYLHLSLFVRTLSNIVQPSGSEPALWLTVQPYIVQADLARWIASLDSGQNLSPVDTSDILSYQVLDCTTYSRIGDSLIPVLLSPDVSLTVRRMKDAQTQLGSDITNDRGAVNIVSPLGFTKDNVRPEKRQGDKISQPPAAPYRVAFMNQISQLSRGIEQSSLIAWLRLHFEISSTRRIRNATVGNLDKVNLFEVKSRLLPDSLGNDPSDPMREVSLLSMCGHMIRLDQSIGFGGLRQLNTFTVSLSRAQAAKVPEIPLPLPDEENQYLASFFATIDPQANGLSSPTSIWQAQLLPDIAKRVYVNAHRSSLLEDAFTFAPGNHDVRTLFRTGSTKKNTGPVAYLSEVECFGIYYPASAGEPPEINLSLCFYEMLALQLKRYRSTTADSQGKILWQLAPLLDSRKRFIEFFSPATNNGATAVWPEAFSLHNMDGKRLETSGALFDSGYIGSYVFAWDDVENVDAETLLPDLRNIAPTVLFLGAESLSSKAALDVYLVVQIRNPVTANPITVNLDFSKVGSASGPTSGANWLWAGAALPAIAWNAMAIANPPSSDFVDKINPIYVRKGDHIFQPAHSASNIEGVLQVIYPIPPAQAVASLNNEIERELVAYRKLNEYSQLIPPDGAGGGSTPLVALNPWSNRPPVFKEDTDDGHYRHTFHFRHQTDVYALPQPWRDNETAARYYQSVYGKFGWKRKITLDLEHTTGHEFQAMESTMAIPHDVPPILASTLRSLPGKKDSLPFLVAEFKKGGPGPDMVTIRVNAEFVDPANTGANAQDVMGKAWRSIAELAYADKVQLRGLFRQFDFSKAVSVAQTQDLRINLQSGLLAVEPLEGIDAYWSLNEMKVKALDWITKGTVDSAGISVALSMPDGGPISSHCDIVEFWLEIVRPAPTLPETAGRGFVLQRFDRVTSDKAYDENGEIYNDVTDSAEQATLTRQYQEYVGILEGSFNPTAANGNGWRAISPDLAKVDKDKTMSMRNLLGATSPDPDRSGIESAEVANLNALDWIYTGNTDKAGNVVAALLPFAFRPLAARYGGLTSYAALCRYILGQEMLIDVSRGTWCKRFANASDWKGWFDVMAQHASNVGKLVNGIRALVVPAFLADDSSNLLDADVKALAQDWQKKAGGLKGLHSEMGRILLAKPSLFSECRALLLTRLKSNNRLPRSLFNVRSVRKISPPLRSYTPTPGVSSARLEQSTLSLSDVVLGDADQKTVAFLEVLGGEKYDARFEISPASFKAYGLFSFLGASGGPDPASALGMDGPHVPFAGGGFGVDLPSRQPLIAPVHLYTNTVAGMEKWDWARQFASGGVGLSMQAITKNRQIQVATPSEAGSFYLYKASDSDFVRSTSIDSLVVAGLFYVTSDENDEFQNDSFRFSLGKVTNSGEPLIKGDGNTANLFKALEGNSALTAIDVWHTALDDATVGVVSAALVPPEITEEKGEFIEIKFDTKGNIAPGIPPSYAVFMFKQKSDFKPKSHADGPCRYLLIISTEAKVWTPFAMKLYHTRNVRPALNSANPATIPPSFNPMLWQFSSLVGDTEAMDLKRIYTLDAPPFRLPSRSMSIENFVQKTLVASKLLESDNNSQEWKSTDASILVGAVLRASFPIFSNENIASSLQTVSHGILPLWNALYVPGNPAASDAIMFDESRLEFAVDLTWTSARNAEILRIQNLLVSF